MSNILKVICIWVPIVFTGCQSLNQGNHAYNQGKFDLAAYHWNSPAINGNPYAQYNLGMLWESGLGSTPKNNNEACAWYLKSAEQGYVPAMVRLAELQKTIGYKKSSISWYELAARYGNQDAISALKSLGKNIPIADLQIQQHFANTASNYNQYYYQNIGYNNVVNSYSSYQGIPRNQKHLNVSSMPRYRLPSNDYYNKDQKYKYKGFGNAQYQYDLSKPRDQMRYELDIQAQMRDELSIDVSREIDQSMGLFGGGIKR
jgi:TPR repeat protein